MGCDIHGPWLEQRNSEPNKDGTYHWWPAAELHIGRNYRLFALIAGVRDYEGITMGQPTFAAKGFPKNAGYRAVSKYTLYVRENDQPDEENTCTREQAESWIEQGISEPWHEIGGKFVSITDPDAHTPSWLDTEEVETLVQRFARAQAATVDDAKKQQDDARKLLEEALDGASTPEEVQRLRDNITRMTRWDQYDPMSDYDLHYMMSVLTFMKALEKPNRPCRIIFWFDN